MTPPPSLGPHHLPDPAGRTLTLAEPTPPVGPQQRGARGRAPRATKRWRQDTAKHGERGRDALAAAGSSLRMKSAWFASFAPGRPLGTCAVPHGPRRRSDCVSTPAIPPVNPRPVRPTSAPKRVGGAR